MTGLPFDTNSPQPAIRKPVFEVTAGSGSSDSGGLGGMVSDLIGGDGGQDPWQRCVSNIVVYSSLGPTADYVVIELREDGDAPDIALGDELQIALGYADSETTTVLSGEISIIQRDLRGACRVHITNGSHRLLKGHLNSSFEEQNAGDIVKHLSGEAGVDTDTVDDGVDYPFYVIDDRRSLYHHMNDLARQNGFVLTFSPEGKLNFAAVNGEVVATFTYAVDLISLSLDESATHFGQTTVVGAGASGSEGTDAWCWINSKRDPIASQQGSGDAAMIQRVAALRSADAVQAAATAQLDRVSALGLKGKIRVPGTPQLLAGSTFEVSETTDGLLDGTFVAQKVSHVFNKRGGFTTEIEFVGEASSGGGGLLGGVL